MPSSVTILCQIRSKGQDGGFVSGLANYMIEPGKSKPFHYGFIKNKSPSSCMIYKFRIMHCYAANMFLIVELCMWVLSKMYFYNN